MLLILSALWLRSIRLDYRSKLEDTKRDNAWHIDLSISDFVPPLILGLAFYKLLQGVSFQLSDIMMREWARWLQQTLQPNYHSAINNRLFKPRICKPIASNTSSKSWQ
ncbi:hypothetical protein F0244_01460 [Vibrio mediterranei]|nr:hypothetical protein [Vibrio mediterranei]